MSAFLGPIHYWVYNKIQIQQTIINQIISLGKTIDPHLQEELDLRYGESETRPLEDVIDQGNIHGWLQQQVSQAEYKLAYSITDLIKKDQDLLNQIETIFENIGKEKVNLIIENHAAEAFKVISDSLLDGMPCDHANTVIEESNDKVIWKRNTCVHQSYWDAVGGDITIYYSLREAFIKGLLSNTKLCYEQIDEFTSMIRRKDRDV